MPLSDCGCDKTVCSQNAELRPDGEIPEVERSLLPNCGAAENCWLVEEKTCYRILMILETRIYTLE